MNRKIYKARAEEFIHIFVHQKAKLIEFLEHMVQVMQQFQRVSYHCFSLDRKKQPAQSCQASHAKETYGTIKINSCSTWWWKKFLPQKHCPIRPLPTPQKYDFPPCSFSLVRNKRFTLSFLWSQVQPHSSNLVYNTLLELYLNDAARQKNVEVL